MGGGLGGGVGDVVDVHGGSLHGLDALISVSTTLASSSAAAAAAYSVGAISSAAATALDSFGMPARAKPFALAAARAAARAGEATGEARRRLKGGASNTLVSSHWQADFDSGTFCDGSVESGSTDDKCTADSQVRIPPFPIQ